MLTSSVFCTKFLEEIPKNTLSVQFYLVLSLFPKKQARKTNIFLVKSVFFFILRNDIQRVEAVVAAVVCPIVLLPKNLSIYSIMINLSIATTGEEHFSLVCRNNLPSHQRRASEAKALHCRQIYNFPQPFAKLQKKVGHCNGCSPFKDKENFTPNRPFQLFQIYLDLMFLQLIL